MGAVRFEKFKVNLELQKIRNLGNGREMERNRDREVLLLFHRQNSSEMFSSERVVEMQ